MTDPKFKEFCERLNALCVEFDYVLSATEWAYLESAQPGKGHNDLDLCPDVSAHDPKFCELCTPPAPRVKPEPTPEELAAKAQREALLNASRESWRAGAPKTGPLLPPPHPEDNPETER